MEATALLNQIMNSQAPESIVCCGKTACRIAGDWAESHPGVEVSTLSPENPNDDFPLARVHDLALVSHTLENLPQSQANTLLGQLRNAGARRIAVLVAADKTWRFADFIALGFKRSHHTAGERPQTLYTYDIANYNHKRKWNNAENWANSHMWNKARW